MFYIEGGEHQKEMPTRQRMDQVLMQKEDLFIYQSQKPEQGL